MAYTFERSVKISIETRWYYVAGLVPINTAAPAE